MRSKKIIVEVKSGVIQNIFSSDKDIEVEILDWDDIGCREITPEERLINNKTRFMEQIY